MQWKQSVLSIKDKQTIISLLEKGKKEQNNVALKVKISEQKISYIRKNRQDPEIHRQHRDEGRIENTWYLQSVHKLK